MGGVVYQAPDRNRRVHQVVEAGEPTPPLSGRPAGRSLGLAVEVLDDPFPATPIVIGRLRGGDPGPTIVLNGHLDTVPIPHDPPRVEGGRVWGRGSADMKGPVAAATEDGTSQGASR